MTDTHRLTFGGITITLVRGEIAKQTACVGHLWFDHQYHIQRYDNEPEELLNDDQNKKKKDVDVIVNTTSNSLDLRNGSVSSSLLMVGGEELQHQCHMGHPQGVEPGQVAITTGGKLQCQIVCHGALLSWDNEALSKQMLHDFMGNCLFECSNRKYRSIAFPALGTGNLGYPSDVTAREMITEVSRFGQKRPNSTLSDVRIVVYHNDLKVVQSFKDVFKQFESDVKGQNNFANTLPVAQTPSGKPAQLQRHHSESALKDSNPRHLRESALKDSDPIHVLDEDFELLDDHVDKAMKFIRRKHPKINGLQEACIGAIEKFEKHSDPFIQVFHAGGRHWITISNMNCQPGTVRVYDSKYRTIPEKTGFAILSLMVFEPRHPVKVEMPKFQKQENLSNCGVFSIAAACALAEGNDPSVINFDVENMRPHLFNCLQKKIMKEFPQIRKDAKKLPCIEFELFQCVSCKRPVFANEKNVKKCEKCGRFCHGNDKCYKRQYASCCYCRF